MKKKISVIVPCYNEQESLPLFYEEVIKVADKMKDVSFEFIFVNDGSRDGTLLIMRELAREDKRVRYASLSRNFGKEGAMYAGLSLSKGDYVCVMDADLQDPPSLLPELLETIENEGYDCIATRSISRHGYSFIRKTCTRWFYKIINSMSKTEMIDGARDFRLMKRKMVDAILSMKEYNRYSKGIFSFVGFKTKWIEFENQERAAGVTKYSFWKLFVYALEGIIGFSTAPLVIASVFGIIFFLASIVMILVIIARTLLFGDPTSGWPSLVCIIFFVSGIQLFCTGILGQYLAKTYLETKNRPIYIIGETEEDL